MMNIWLGSVILTAETFLAVVSNMNVQHANMWYDPLKQFRIKPGYNILSIKNPLSMPKRLGDKISALTQSFMMENSNGQLKKKGATLRRLTTFTLLTQKFMERSFQMSLVN